MASRQCNEASEKEEAKSFELHVHGLSGFLCTVSTNSLATCRALKQSIAKQTDIPAPQQRLFFGEQEISCSDTLGAILTDAADKVRSSAGEVMRADMKHMGNFVLAKVAK